VGDTQLSPAARAIISHYSAGKKMEKAGNKPDSCKVEPCRLCPMLTPRLTLEWIQAAFNFQTLCFQFQLVPIQQGCGCGC